jgi:hypothetical protein
VAPTAPGNWIHPSRKNSNCHAFQVCVNGLGVIGLYLGYRKRMAKDDSSETIKTLGRLSTLGVWLCHLPGAAGVGMIRAQGTLQILRR